MTQTPTGCFRLDGSYLGFFIKFNGPHLPILFVALWIYGEPFRQTQFEVVTLLGTS